MSASLLNSNLYKHPSHKIIEFIGLGLQAGNNKNILKGVKHVVHVSEKGENASNCGNIDFKEKK